MHKPGPEEDPKKEDWIGLVNTKTKILVKTLQGKILKFEVNNFAIGEGFVTFVDPKTGEVKKFGTSNCEIVDPEVIDSGGFDE